MKTEIEIKKHIRVLKDLNSQLKENIEENIMPIKAFESQIDVLEWVLK